MYIKNRLSKSPFVQLDEAGGEVPYAKIIQEGLGAAKRKKLTSNVWDAYTQLIYNLEGVYLDFLYPDIDQCGRYCRAYMYKLIDHFCKGKERREIFFLCFGFLEGYEQPLLGERRKKYKQKVSPQLGNGSVGKTWLEEEDKITEWLSQKLAHQIVENRGKIGLLDNLDLSYKLVDPRHYNSSHVAGKGREKKGGAKGHEPEENNNGLENTSSTCLTNLPLKNTYFTGKAIELRQIQQNISDGYRIQTIYGLAGVGKTQLAIQYAQEHLSEYQIVWFINTETEEDIDKELKSFFASVHEDANEQGRELRRHFSTYLSMAQLKWLLIFDNSDYESDETQALLQEIIPSTGIGRIIITTQASTPFFGMPQVEAKLFPEEDSLRFLEKRTGKSADAHARELVDLYGCHPLALEYAGSYICRDGMTYEKYVRLLKDKGSVEMLRKNRFGVKGYKNTIIRAFQITLDRIRDESKSDEIMARVESILNLCAVIAPEEIPLDFFEYIADTLPSPYHEAFADDLATDETLYAITKYSLFTKRTDKTVFMHRLLKEVVYESLTVRQIEDVLNIFRNYKNVFIGVQFRNPEFLDAKSENINALPWVWKKVFVTTQYSEPEPYIRNVLGIFLLSVADSYIDKEHDSITSYIQENKIPKEDIEEKDNLVIFHIRDKSILDLTKEEEDEAKADFYKLLPEIAAQYAQAIELFRLSKLSMKQALNMAFMLQEQLLRKRLWFDANLEAKGYLRAVRTYKGITVFRDWLSLKDILDATTVMRNLLMGIGESPDNKIINRIIETTEAWITEMQDSKEKWEKEKDTWESESTKENLDKDMEDWRQIEASLLKEAAEIYNEDEY